MDLSPVGVFVKVVQAGSFSAAARHLSMPNSTVSAQVARLERRLGVTLLQRSTRRLRLTEAGEAYFRSACQGIDLIQVAETEISASQQDPQGMLRLTTTVDLLPPAAIADLLAKFNERYPKVSIEVDLSQRIVDLLHEGIDVAIRAGELPDSSLIARKVSTSIWVLVASPAYLRSADALGEPADLQHHALLQFQSRGRDQWQLRRGRKTITLPLPKRTIVNHLDVVRSLTLLDKGVALLPTYCVREDLAEGRLIRVLPEWCGGVDPIYMLYPGQKYVAAKVRAFVDFAADILKSHLRE